MNKKSSLFLPTVIFIGLSFSGCAPYKVVKLGPGVDGNNVVTPFYAVARNNIVIPEYVVDAYGNYPTTEDEAQKRFKSQKEKVEPYINEKYDLSANPGAEFSRNSMGILFSLVSPIAIPVSWLGEVFSSSSEMPKRGFSKVASDYFNASFNPPGYERPRIRERIDYFY